MLITYFDSHLVANYRLVGDTLGLPQGPLGVPDSTLRTNVLEVFKASHENTDNVFIKLRNILSLLCITQGHRDQTLLNVIKS